MAFLRRLWPTLGRDIVLNSLIASPLVPMQARWRLLRAYGMDVAPSQISTKVWFGSKNITIGVDTFIQIGCMFSTHERITIGEHCALGMRVLVFTASHEIASSRGRAGKLITAPVTIGDGCWIGANATIMPGVTIGPGTIIAAGAVVTKDCDANSVYAGVPAVKKRDLATL